MQQVKEQLYPSTPMYDPVSKRIYYKGDDYYFYNGKIVVDEETEVIMRLLKDGFKPSYDNCLIELYLDMIGNKYERL